MKETGNEIRQLPVNKVHIKTFEHQTSALIDKKDHITKIQNFRELEKQNEMKTIVNRDIFKLKLIAH